jgi:hypothetical protein
MDSTNPPRLGNQGLEIKMARFHAMTWVDGDFERTASVLSFNSKAARAAYPAQSAQRVENIDARRKDRLLREGRSHRLMLWDASEPTRFVATQ